MTQPDLQKRPFERAELIDLFKHWDLRVSHQELLFTPLAAAAIPAVVASWDKIDELLTLAVAIGSIGLYLFHIFTVRRFAVFQANIFSKLKNHVVDFDDIVIDPNKRLGVQRLRLLVLPVLSSLWVLLLFARLECPTIYWWGAMILLFLVPTSITVWLWGGAESAN